MKKNSGWMILLVVVCIAFGCNAKMINATKLEKSVNIVVTDYLPKLEASNEPTSIKKANKKVALGLKELVDRAVHGVNKAKAKRKELEKP